MQELKKKMIQQIGYILISDKLLHKLKLNSTNKTGLAPKMIQ